MIRVVSLIEEGKIPSSFPHKCLCGSELETNENLTDLKCSNPFCPIHNGHKVCKTLEVLGIGDGIGEASGIELFEDLGLIHPIELLKDECVYRLKTSGYIKYEMLAFAIDRLKEESIPFYKVVDALQLETIGSTRAKKIFLDIASPSDFYAMFDLPDKDPLDLKFEDFIQMRYFIAEKLDIDCFTETVNKICIELIFLKKFILSTESIFKFKKPCNKSIMITITGEILNVKNEDGSKFKPREKFCDYITEKCGINCIHMSSFSPATTNYLIMDEESMKGKSKYRKAVASGIPVLTSDAFLDLFKDKEVDLRWS